MRWVRQLLRSSVNEQIYGEGYSDWSAPDRTEEGAVGVGAGGKPSEAQIRWFSELRRSWESHRSIAKMSLTLQ